MRARSANRVPRPPAVRPVLLVNTSPSAAKGAISIGSAAVVSLWIHRSAPVLRESAKALVSVLPNSRRPSVASPFGPPFGRENLRRQTIAPVRAFKA